MFVLNRIIVVKQLICKSILNITNNFEFRIIITNTDDFSSEIKSVKKCLVKTFNYGFPFNTKTPSNYFLLKLIDFTAVYNRPNRNRKVVGEAFYFIQTVRFGQYNIVFKPVAFCSFTY